MLKVKKTLVNIDFVNRTKQNDNDCTGTTLCVNMTNNNKGKYIDR